MRAEKEVSDAVKPGNRPAPLKPEGDWSHAFSYHPMDVEVQKAEGIHYYDVEGNQYIDASGGPFAFTLPLSYFSVCVFISLPHPLHKPTTTSIRRSLVISVYPSRVGEL